MDLVTTLRLMARRWIVVVPILLLTAGAAVAAGSTVAPSYQARASVLILPLAAEGTGASGVNPYGEYGGQRLAVSHLISLADSAAFTLEVVGGPDATSTFELTPQADVGLIDAVVTGPSNAETIDTMNRLIDLIDRSLGDLQRDIDAPEESWVQMRRLDTPEQAAQLAGSRNRVIVGVAALGLLAAVGAAFALEGLIGRRTRRSEEPGRRARRRATRAAAGDEATLVTGPGADDPAAMVPPTAGAAGPDPEPADRVAVDTGPAPMPNGAGGVPEPADPDPASAR